MRDNTVGPRGPRDFASCPPRLHQPPPSSEQPSSDAHHRAGSSPPPAELSASTLSTLRAALVELDRTGKRSVALEEAVCAAARDARALGITPERALVSLKTMWHDVESTHRAAERHAHARVLEEMISLCIREYFA